MEGLVESANRPMMGIVHVSPGRCRFLYRQTACSKARMLPRTAAVVYNQLMELSLAAEAT